MTEETDLPHEMIRLLDDDLMEAILTGNGDGSVPAEYVGVAELARAARTTADTGVDLTAAERIREAELVAAIASAVRAPSPSRARRHVRRTRTAVVAAFAAVTLSATGAAAATDHLPHPIQSALSNAASHVGVHLPTGDSGSDHPAPPPPATEEAPNHTDVSASSASGGVSDNAPPAVTPASGNDDGVPGNSAHDQSPGDVASEAHTDNPSSQDDAHAQNGSDNSDDHGSATTVPPSDRGQGSLHSNSIKSDHSNP